MTMGPARPAASVGVAIAVGLAGCGEEPDAGGSGKVAQADGAMVAITDRGFEPKTIRVPVGARVTWVNEGSAPNSVQTWHDIAHQFDIHTIRPGKRKSYIFKKPGRYEYFSAWGDAAKYQGVVQVTRRQ